MCKFTANFKCNDLLTCWLSERRAKKKNKKQKKNNNIQIQKNYCQNKVT